jgi:hypothetical protein
MRKTQAELTVQVPYHSPETAKRAKKRPISLAEKRARAGLKMDDMRAANSCYALPVFVFFLRDNRTGKADIFSLDTGKATAMQFFNFSTKKVGGLRFVKLGRFCFSFCVCREYRPIGAKSEERAEVVARGWQYAEA